MDSKTAITSLLLFCVSLTGSAAVQYGVDLHQDGYNIKAKGDGGWYLDVKSDSILYFNTDLTQTTSVIQNKWGGLASAANDTDLGYFVFADNKIISQESLSFQNGIASVKLNAGDQIGLWITDLNGKTSYSMKFTGDYANIFNGRDSYGPYDPETGKWENRVFMYSAAGNGANVLPVIFGVEDAPSGQPLPGIGAALLLGGGVLGVRVFRRRKLRKNA